MKHILILIITFFLLLSCLSNNQVVKNDVHDAESVSIESIEENIQADEIKPIDTTADVIIELQTDSGAMNTIEQQSSNIESQAGDFYVEKNNENIEISNVDNEANDIPVIVVDQTNDVVSEVLTGESDSEEFVQSDERSDQTDDRFVSEDTVQYNDNVLRYADLLKNYQLKN